MKHAAFYLTLGALALAAPAVAMASPGHGGSGATPHATMTAPASSTTTTSTTAPQTQKGPSQTGQPNQSCGSATAPNTPGHAASAPGSAFNPDGKAGTVYAGTQDQNSKNTASVSQYDVACANQK